MSKLNHWLSVQPNGTTSNLLWTFPSLYAVGFVDTGFGWKILIFLDWRWYSVPLNLRFLLACTICKQNFSYCADFWSEKKEMEWLGHLQAIYHTWSRIKPNELPDLEWAEQSYLGFLSSRRLGKDPHGAVRTDLGLDSIFSDRWVHNSAKFLCWWMKAKKWD